MSRIHLRSNTLVLWLSLSAVVAASAVGVGCSSSSDSAPGGTAGKSGGSGGSGAKAGSGNSEAGEQPAVGGGETGEGGSEDAPPAGGSGGTGGSAPVGGSPGGGDAGQPGEGGAGGTPDGEDPAVTAAQTHALALIAALPEVDRCTACHDVTFQGAGFYPNITPDPTNGIGTWDISDIKTAIRDGKDKDGETLCTAMKRYTQFTDDELTDIAIFLQHLPAKTKKITAKCPL
ncbi:MAG: cytochrome c [Pseudomonadota bacterium]